MKNELYELYKQCFPKSQLSKELFLEEIDYENSNIFITQEHCHMVGASVVDKNALRLLCVAPSMQGKGYGEKLLKRSEEAIQEDGYEEAILYKSDRLFSDMNMDELKELHFFTHHNYKPVKCDVTTWGSKQLAE